MTCEVGCLWKASGLQGEDTPLRLDSILPGQPPHFLPSLILLCVDHSEHPPFRLPQREGLSIYLVAESQLCLCLSPLYRDLKPLEPFSLFQITENPREPSKLWLPKPERTTLVKSTVSRPLCLELRPTSFSGEAQLTLDTGNGRLGAFCLLTRTFSSFSLRTRVYWHAFIAVTGFHFFFHNRYFKGDLILEHNPGSEFNTLLICEWI